MRWLLSRLSVRDVVKVLTALVLYMASEGAVAQAMSDQSPWDKPVAQVRSDIERLLNCKWSVYYACSPDDFEGRIHLYKDASGAKVSAVAFGSLIYAVPRNAKREDVNREITLKILGYFLPEWERRRA